MNPAVEDILAEGELTPDVVTPEEVQAEIDAAAPEIEIEIAPEAEAGPVEVEKRPAFDERVARELEAADELSDIVDPIRKKNIRERIERLTHNLRETESQRDALHKDAEETFKYANGARGALESMARENAELKKSLQREALAARDARLEVTQREFQAAREQNDVTKEGEIAQRLAVLAQERAQLSQYAVPEAWVPPAPPQRQARADASDLTPATNRWLSENQWFTADPSPDARRMRKMATDLSEQLESEGVAPNNETHYARIDAELRRRFPERFGNTGATMQDPAKAQTSATQRRPPVATAPRTPGANGTRKVVLTASQAAKDKEEAAMFGVSVQNYQRNKYRAKERE